MQGYFAPNLWHYLEDHPFEKKSADWKTPRTWLLWVQEKRVRSISTVSPRWTEFAKPAAILEVTELDPK